MGFGDKFEHWAYNATAAPLCHSTRRQIQERRMGIATRRSKASVGNTSCRLGRVFYNNMKHKEIEFDRV